MSIESGLQDELHSLPPDLPHPADRFEQVQGRVTKHRRRQVAGAVVVAVASVAIAAPVIMAGDDATRTTGVDPVAPVRPGGDPPGSRLAPGAMQVAPLGSTVDEVHTGTATLSLGAPPTDATGVAIALQCLSAGTFNYPDGAKTVCNRADGRTSIPADAIPVDNRYVIDLPTDDTTFSITTSPGAKWRAVASYVATRITDWGVNENGQTFGVPNENGYPDLVAVAASTGGSGYAYSEQIDEAPQV